jgi:mycothiol synthase
MPRSYRSSDAPAVAAFLAAVHEIEPSVLPTSEAQWIAFTERPSNRRGRDFAVVERDGGVIAVLTSTILDDPRVPRGIRHFRIIVHPAHRRRGVGRALLRMVEAQRERDATAMLQSVVRRAWIAGHRFLEAAGFRAAFGDVLLELRAVAPADSSTAPSGIALRAYDGPRDHEAWAALSNAGFARDATSHTETAETVAGYTSAPGFGLWIAEDDGAPVGFCHFEDAAAGASQIQGLVVAASHEGRGIGSALLARAISSLANRGRGRIELVTETSNERALRLYRRFGFEPMDELTTYRRVVT